MRRLDISKAKKEFGFEVKSDFKKGPKRTIERYKETREAGRFQRR